MHCFTTTILSVRDSDLSKSLLNCVTAVVAHRRKDRRAELAESTAAVAAASFRTACPRLHSGLYHPNAADIINAMRACQRIKSSCPLYHVSFCSRAERLYTTYWSIWYLVPTKWIQLGVASAFVAVFTWIKI